MKKALQCISILFLIHSPIYSQFFKGIQTNFLYSFRFNEVIAKDSASYLALNHHIVKIDASGNVQWDLSNNSLYNSSIKFSLDNNLYVLSSRDTQPNVDYFYLSKINLDGIVLWTKKINYPGEQITGKELKVLPTGKLLIRALWNGSDLFICTDSVGNMIYARDLGYIGMGSQYNYNFAVTSTGGFYYAGYDFITNKTIVQKRLPDGLLDFRLAISDSLNNAFNIGNRSITSGDDGCIIFRTAYDSAYINKVSKVGDIQWSKKYMPSLCYTHFNFEQVFASPDHNYFVSGNFQPCLSFHISSFLLKLDSLGNPIWAKLYSSSNRDINNVDCFVDSSNNIYLSGYDSNSPSYTYVLRTDSLGNSPCSDSSFIFQSQDVFIKIDSISSNSLGWPVYSYPDTLFFFSNYSLIDYCSAISVSELPFNKYGIIYPNPAHNTFTISFNGLSSMVNGHLQIFDVMGRAVHEQAVNNQSTIIDKQFSAGVYFVKVRVGERVFTEKMVVE
jgi:hypothetical protein